MNVNIVNPISDMAHVFVRYSLDRQVTRVFKCRTRIKIGELGGIRKLEACQVRVFGDNLCLFVI